MEFTCEMYRVYLELYKKPPAREGLVGGPLKLTLIRE